MHSENFIWQLASRSLSGEASCEEVALLEETLKQDESLQQRYEILKQFWHSSHPLTTSNDESKKHIARILEKAYKADVLNENLVIETKRLRYRKIFRNFLRSAAVIIFLIVGLVLFNKKGNYSLPSQSPDKNMQQLVAQKGSRNRTILPDGSVVWLNAGSSLSYAGDFKSSAREVYLKGEGFFDVVKENNHPFIVHANSVDIKVLGTAFNLKSYAEDNRVEATLIRGLIQVMRQGKGNQKPVFLYPNEKLIINLPENISKEKIQTGEKTIAPVVFKLYHLDSTIKKENIIETSWIYNRLEFRGDSFEELAKKLERWYNIKIIFEDEAVKHLSFNGSFENETAEQAFAALQSAVPFDYTMQEQEVKIKSAAAN